MILPFPKRPPVKKPAEVDRDEPRTQSVLGVYKMLAAAVERLDSDSDSNARGHLTLIPRFPPLR
jgi:hypothetical protein